MANINYLTALLFVLSHLQIWTSSKPGRWTKPCFLRDLKKLRAQRKFGNRVLNVTVKQWNSWHNGPKRSKFYDPTYGYEPYWEGGDWVFDKLEPEKEDMCGVRCNPVFIRYGAICGRDKNYKHETFENYCKMRDRDCINTQGWLIAYRGECREDLKTNPTAAKKIVTRAMKWLANFSEKYYG